MTIISEEVLKVISEHTTRDRSGFDVLRKRFESTNDYSPSAAAAIGYLIAKDELEAAKEEEEPDVYDEVVVVLKAFLDTRVSTHTTADEIFTLIYKWLDDELAKHDFVAIPRHTKNKIHELFLPFIIKKSEA